MQRAFTTPEPVSLFVELRSGDLTVHTGDVTETVVEVTGSGEDDVRVEQRGHEVVVIGKHGLLGASAQHLSVHVSAPHDSRLSTRLGSADLRVRGRLGETTAKSGSGDVWIEALSGRSRVDTGSGDVYVGAAGATLQVKSGSGDVVLDRLEAPAEVSTGSGDVTVASALASVSAKSGSGGLRVREAHGDVSLASASGDLLVDLMHRGQLTARNASGDIAIGVPSGVPVWTEISTTSGTVHSDLVGAGEPADGQDFVALHASTVSGDVLLEQV